MIHAPVQQIPDNADVIVTHNSLAAAAKKRLPTAAIVPFMMFFGDPAVKGVVEKLKRNEAIVSAV